MNIQLDVDIDDMLNGMSVDEKLELLSIILSDRFIKTHEIEDALNESGRSIEREMPEGSTIMEQEFYDSLLILEKGYLRLSNSDIEKISEIAKSI